jgi:hypothetical protein
METRVGELGPLLLPIALLSVLGAAIVLRAFSRARYISRTASPAYAAVPMQLLNFRLAPLTVDGTEIATDQLTVKSSMVIVGYGYRVNGKSYVSDAVFPMEIEWFKPRLSARRLMDDLESGRLRSCHVSVRHPSEALLFTGWSPQLRSHVLGVALSGILLVVLSAVLYWFV